MRRRAGGPAPRLAAGLGAVLLLAAMPAGGAAQGLGEAILERGDGTVRFTFAAREGVLFCDHGIRLHGGGWVSGEARRGQADGCAPGPVRVEVEVRHGRVADVTTLHARRRPTPGARDLGVVDPLQARDFLLGVARTGGEGRAAGEAVFPAVLADVPEGWRAVMELAGDTRVGGAARRSALFWLGQEAASAATEGLSAVAADEDEEQGVRDAAVFALSRRPAHEGVPVLMELARTARDARTRRSAFFWLSQSDDPRVVSFFRETLLGGRGG